MKCNVKNIVYKMAEWLSKFYFDIIGALWILT